MAVSQAKNLEVIRKNHLNVQKNITLQVYGGQQIFYTLRHGRERSIQCPEMSEMDVDRAFAKSELLRGADGRTKRTHGEMVSLKLAQRPPASVGGGAI
ncbi:hypothetical protein EVAR_57552_1 [Eumeta japonica]|uniref:Uncharacterized protein n=1 Tax=Eumeta variegata TaxID=151549 RepID=A0A4C1Y440_EUMVA|nr:hypothetical protein EVAR_57552_1 [Eumeta japonica]